MLEIDGAQKSGSGTIVRLACGIAALRGEELHLVNIRARRDKAGLRPQHLKAIEALREICQGKLEGGKVGSGEIRFRPGGAVKGGHYQWDIGTAGSTTLLVMTLLPVACLGRGAMSFTITGGLFQDFAPSAYHLQNVLFPLLARMGVSASIRMVRPGYVPRGGGIIEVEVKPVTRLKPLELLEPGPVIAIEGVALSSHLKERQVSERMAKQCTELLRAKGYPVHISIVNDDTAVQAGAALAVHAKTSSGAVIGSDMAGRPGRSSEEIGKQVARSLLADLASGATVDRYVADQLILYAALAEGVSRYRLPRVTEHVESNLWLVGLMLGVRSEIKDNLLTINGVGFTR